MPNNHTEQFSIFPASIPKNPSGEVRSERVIWLAGENLANRLLASFTMDPMMGFQSHIEFSLEIRLE